MAHPPRAVPAGHTTVMLGLPALGAATTRAEIARIDEGECIRRRTLALALSLVLASCSDPVVDTTTTGAGDEISALRASLARLEAEITRLEAEITGQQTTSSTQPSPTEPTGPFMITLNDYRIEGDLTIPAGVPTFVLRNRAFGRHTFEITGVASSPEVADRSSLTWSPGQPLAPGIYEVFCNLSDHRARGMRATLTVIGEGFTPDDHELDHQAISDAMVASMLAFPVATEGRGNQVLEPTIGADGAIEFTLTASVVPWEVAPGQIVQAWAYNGMVPGPVIKVDVGDRVRVRVINRLPMGTDVHFHGVPLPNGMDGVAPLTQDLIEPGGEFTYEFVAERAVVAMYHSHHHAIEQIPNGLLGAFLIGDMPLPLGRTIGGIPIPTSLDLVDEIPMIVNDSGVIGLSLNGKSFPATEPYHVTVGDWYLVHYMNMGMQAHPMHQHGYPGLVIARDGVPLESPFWVDTLLVAPAERYTVLFQATEPGVWLWHCHIVAHIEDDAGMTGMVTAVYVDP